MGQIYLVRHGETAWNKAKIFRGRRDIPLNEQGRLEAACAARALRQVPLAAVYSSPLSRARETAETVAAGRDLGVTVDEAFTDLDYGEWTEYWDVEARAKFGDQYRQWKESPHLVKFPDGESLDDVRRRAAPRLTELARQNLGRHRSRSSRIAWCSSSCFAKRKGWTIPTSGKSASTPAPSPCSNTEPGGCASRSKTTRATFGT